MEKKCPTLTKTRLQIGAFKYFLGGHASDPPSKSCLRSYTIQNESEPPFLNSCICHCRAASLNFNLFFSFSSTRQRSAFRTPASWDVSSCTNFVAWSLLKIPTREGKANPPFLAGRKRIEVLEDVAKSNHFFLEPLLPEAVALTLAIKDGNLQ